MAVAALAWAGALLAVPVPRVLLGGVVVAAGAARRPALVALAAFVLASGLAAAALSGLDPPVPATYRGPVTLLTDPEPVASGQHVEVRLRHRHLDAWAQGGAAGALVERLSGERVWITGRVEPLPRTEPWLTARHVAGRLEIEAVDGWAPGPPVTRAANGLRRILLAGAAGLSDDTRALFAGFVLGDDRGRSALVTDDFRGAGLTHLLAVSGENVAFVLVVLDPLLRRLGLRPRLVVTLVALAFFALLTRFEPSVLRATAMAALAVIAATWGREASSVRILALAVSALILVDPLLVRTVGFQLSVAASAGIVVLAPVLVEVLPGPRSVRLALSVSVAAQAGVGPVLLATFGAIPVVSLPANLAAAPAAGPITVWGLTAGLMAGLLPALAPALHLPTRLLVGWVARVARVAVSVPLGQVHVATFALLCVAGAVAALAHRAGRRRLRGAALGTLLVAALLPALALRVVGPPPHERLGGDAELWRADASEVLALDGRVREEDLLQSLRERGVTDLDLIVCTSASGALRPVVTDLRRRFGGIAVLAPTGSSVAGAQVPSPGSVVTLGSLVLTVHRATSDELEVAVTSSRGTAAPAGWAREGPV